jgi:hypothetical protein
MLGPAACLLLAVSPGLGIGATSASALITLGLGLSALTLGGVSANHLDICPRHAGAQPRARACPCARAPLPCRGQERPANTLAWSTLLSS